MNAASGVWQILYCVQYEYVVYVGSHSLLILLSLEYIEY